MWGDGQEVSLSTYPHLYKLWCGLRQRSQCRAEYPGKGIRTYPGAQGNVLFAGRRETLLDRLPLLVSPYGRRASGLDEGRTPVHLWRGVSDYLL